MQEPDAISARTTSQRRLRPLTPHGRLARKIGWTFAEPPNWYRKSRIRYKVTGSTAIRGWSIRHRLASWLLGITDDRWFTIDRQTHVQQFLRLRLRFGRPHREWT